MAVSTSYQSIPSSSRLRPGGGWRGPSSTSASATIICPNCKTEIRLTESLAAPLIEATREQFEQKLQEKDLLIRAKEAAVTAEKHRLDEQRQELENTIAQRVKEAGQQIAAEEARKAQERVKDTLTEREQELAGLRELIEEKNSKLVEAQKAQVELIRKQRELDDAKREIDLTIETKVQESLNSARDEGRRQAEQALSLKVREREETIAAMQRQIEDLKRKAEQGSQQLQGEVLEVDLEERLAANFPFDRFEPVAKGEFGGDLVQRVVSNSGKESGTILWEMKRTRNWSQGWLAKLRNDQRLAGADAAILVSQALPDGIETFGLTEGVWVAAPHCAIPVALAIREILVSVAAARQTGEGQLTKMELIYDYLTGPRFRHRIEAIVEQFTAMQDDLDRERKAMTKLWARREQQIRCVVESTAGMYGDLQGIAGRSIQEVDGLDFDLLEHKEDE